MVGLGETDEELVQTFRDLREVGVDVLTLGQYLQPSQYHLRVERFVPPAEFDAVQAGGGGDGLPLRRRRGRWSARATAPPSSS